jgi:hypothetical protein
MSMQVNWLALFADDIEYAISCGNESLKRMAKRLVFERSLSNTQFYTDRFELGIGIDLHKARIPFTKRESPDYDLYEAGGIECTSTRFNLPTANWAQVGPKIEKTVRGKATMEYAGSNVALCVDITPILAVLPKGEMRLDKSFTQNWILRGGGAAYGSIIIFYTMISFTTGMVGRNYIRVDQIGLSSKLQPTLETIFPISPTPTEHTEFLVPPEKYEI